MIKRKVPNVVRGGKAIPLKGKTNYYYMQGRKHSSGGIDIGENPRTGLEVEDGEVMHVADKEIKVFSSVPFLNGKSPAQKVIGGENPTKVFNQQEEFKDKHNMNDDGTKKKKRMGGLSRKKDYGSKSKPYPKVKTGDFAGGHRSYPIPTKADARDALRLAGLHGRSDVRAKVYAKYPDLRKKSKTGGLYSVTVNGRTKLRMFPSTGESAARSAAVRAKKVTGGPNGINPDLVEEDTYDYNYFLSPAVNEQLRQERTEAKQRGKNYNTYAVTTNTNVNTNTNSNNGNTDDFKLSKYTVKDYIRDNKENLILDGIGLTSNLAGSIIANRATNYAINKMVAPVKPTAPVNKRAAKLKTRININPQLAKMAESVASYERNVDNNTVSSQVALSRKQKARANAILMANELYADKENRETSLINQDRLNQQSVANANVDSYNKYLDKVNDYENARVAFENQKIARKADNTINLINNINAGIQDVVGKTVKRESENQTISAMALANPNLPIEVLYAQGLVNKRTYDAYKKAYRNKKKDKKD